MGESFSVLPGDVGVSRTGNTHTSPNAAVPAVPPSLTKGKRRIHHFGSQTNEANERSKRTNQQQNTTMLRGSTITLDDITSKTDTSTRQTKIVCTLGPACWDVDQLEDLIEKGLSVARFNFSHGDHAGHKACLDRLRTAAANKGKPVGELTNTVMMACCRFPSCNCSCRWRYSSCWHTRRL